MRFVSTNVFVADIGRSREFYSGILGLEVIHDWTTMLVYRHGLSIIQAGTIHPLVVSQEFFVPGDQGKNNLTIYLESTNLEQEAARIQAAGISLLLGITELPWQRIFRLRDPDGHLVEIGSPLESSDNHDPAP